MKYGLIAGVVRVVWVVVLSAVCGGAWARDLGVARLFGDGAVVQADRGVAVWGSCEPGAEVVVSFAGQTRRAVGGEGGGWRVELAPMEATGVGRVLSVQSGGDVIEVRDVVVGEVWVCSGQSNMEWPLRNSEGGAAGLGDPRVRAFVVPRRAKVVEQGTLDGGRWRSTDKGDISGLSAVAVHFGTRLSEALDRPVGIIIAAVGATPVEAWTDLETLRALPEMASTFAAWERVPEPTAAEFAAYVESFAEWERAVARWNSTPAASRGAWPRRPRQEAFDPENTRRPGVLYNGMIAPIERYTVRGVTWYQGEGNARRSRQYRALLPAFMASWRERFGDAGLPFGIVQIAGWDTGPGHRETVAWVRDAQREVVDADANAGLVITIDTSEDDGDIHPRKKAEIGERLSLWALRDVYGVEGVAEGPRFVGARVVGDAVEVRLRVTGAVRSRHEALGAWEVAGADGRFVEGRARISGADRVLVSSDAVERPVYVRYAWSDWPRRAGMTDETGLPLAPFRTDEEPDPTLEGGR